MNVLAIDIGGTHVKQPVKGRKEYSEFASSSELTPALLLVGARKLAKDWKYDAVSFGFPGPVYHNRPRTRPFDLGKGLGKRTRTQGGTRMQTGNSST